MLSLNKKVTIIIPNLNGRRYLEFCLPTLLAQSYQDFEIILVDNASNDDSVSFVKEHFPQVQILAQSYNSGFAGANNIAIQITRSPYIVTLNNDTKVDSGWLFEMVKVADIHQDVGMIACKVLYMQSPHLVDSAGLEIDRAGMAWSRCNGLKDSQDEKEPYEVFCPPGTAALYKQEMLRQVGLFDEAYFAYCEDMDLGWRARLMGWKCLYVPTAVVYHLHSATSGQGTPFKRYLLTRNRIWTVLKNYPSPELWLNLPKLLLYDLAAALYRVKLEKSLSPLQGRVAALRRLRQVWKQRREIQQKQTASKASWQQLLIPPVNFMDSYREGRRKH
jgi:GT2 family glycosyltransferase